MESALSMRLQSSLHRQQNPFVKFSNLNQINRNPSFPISKTFKPSAIKIKASTAVSGAGVTKTSNNSVVGNLKLAARAIVLVATAAAAISKFQQYPARAEPIPASVTTAESQLSSSPEETRLPEFLESNPEAIDAMKALIQEKLEAGEDEQSLNILKKLVSSQPKNLEYKFLMARLLNEMGEFEASREAFEEILTQNPLSFEALFENALLMDQSGEGEAVITRLEQALAIAEEEKKEKEARDVKMIIAQFQFLQKNIDEALRRYDELLMEDPTDFRPYFCKGMIYSLTDKNDEAKEQFAKYRELSPKKFEVEGYLRTPLSRMKLFGSDKQN